MKNSKLNVYVRVIFACNFELIFICCNVLLTDLKIQDSNELTFNFWDSDCETFWKNFEKQQVENERIEKIFI